MSDSEKWDRLLKQALAPTEEPGEHVNQSIMNQFKERQTMKRVNKKRMSIGVLVAVLTLVMSVTAIAATQLFNSRQVAEQLGENVLAKAFASADAIEINQSAASGDYRFTLHGIVSGAGLKDLEDEDAAAQDIKPDRTYAVVSIARQDGSPMPATSDPAYGEVPFFISPLIKGQKPWQVNIMTMSGGYGEIVRDGVMYRLIECDGVEMFADRGAYLAIIGGNTFYDNKAFVYDENTGEISLNTDYSGISVLFDLPLDTKKADPAKAEAYLKELLKEPSADKASAAPVSAEEAELVRKMEEMKKKLPDGTVIPESVKEAKVDDEGRISYEYKGWSVKLSPEVLFAEGQTGFSEAVQYSWDDKGGKALQFFKDDKGVISGRVIDLN